MKDKIMFLDNYELSKMPRVYLDTLSGIIHELKTPLTRVVEAEVHEAEGYEVNEYRFLIKYRAQTFIKSGFITIDLEYIYSGDKIKLDEFIDFTTGWHNPESVTISDKDDYGFYSGTGIRYNRLAINKVFEFSGVFKRNNKSLRYNIKLVD